MTRRSWIFNVGMDEGALRLDQLVSQHTGLSRRQAREALKLGGVQVNRKRVRVASRSGKPGAEVRVAMDETLGAVPDFEVDVLLEDAWLLVVNKPAGIPTQGTQASDRHDLLALLNRQRPDQRLLLCHRLDQGTSGVLVFAKDPKADLGPRFQDRSVQKTYLARVGQALEAQRVSLPIGRLKLAKPARYGVEGDLLDPKSCLTDVRPATSEETDGLQPGHYVVCEPQTGRTHQIRVHLASLGAPVVGDGLYGGIPDRQMWLHAWKLSFQHPVTGESLCLVAPPARFRAESL